jgi:hypothetical protein
MSQDVLIPRGNPLTEVMELTARDGKRWVAYVEGLPPLERSPALLKQTALPGRRLRFDSPTESRVTLELPAGSPFLAEGQLLRLLDLSRLLQEVKPSPPSRGHLRGRRWMARITHRRTLQARGRRAIADVAHATRLAAEALLVRALDSFTCVPSASPTSWVQDGERVARQPVAQSRAGRYRPAAPTVRYIRRESPEAQEPARSR